MALYSLQITLTSITSFGPPFSPECKNYVEAYEIADIQLFLTYKNVTFLWFSLIFVLSSSFCRWGNWSFYLLCDLSKVLLVNDRTETVSLILIPHIVCSSHEYLLRAWYMPGTCWILNMQRGETPLTPSAWACAQGTEEHREKSI